MAEWPPRSAVIHARVQAHPARAHLHQALIEHLHPLHVEVSSHSSDPPDPWAGYRKCLSDLPACDHVLIVQDDVLPCKNFAPAVEQIAERWPEFPVCLFMGTVPAGTAGKARIAMKNDKRYVLLGPSPVFPLVAVLWPKAKAEQFLEWSRHAKMTRADDNNAAKWLQRTKQQVMVSVPSLVEHDDFQPSVKGGRDSQGESWRRALFVAEDGLNYEW